MGYAMTNESELVRDDLAELVNEGARQWTIVYSSKRLSPDIVPAFPGATYRSDLGIGRMPMAGLVAGRSAVWGTCVSAPEL